MNGLQNAMTSSEERTSAESRALPHREVTDGLRRPPPSKGATQSISDLEQIIGCKGFVWILPLARSTFALLATGAASAGAPSPARR